MADPSLKVWRDVLAYLRKHHPGVCRRWFEEELSPIELAGGALTLRAKSSIHRDYLRNYCATEFTQALQAITGQLASVRFVGPGDTIPTNNKQTPQAEPLTKTPEPIRMPTSRDGSLPINPDYGFETFVVGPSNRLAHAAAVAVAENPGSSYNPLFIHGSVGLGKTHLLQAICLRLLEQKPGAVICYLSCEAFMTRFMNAVRTGDMLEFRAQFRDVDALVIDDIQFIGPRDRTQEEFFHTFNDLYQANRQIVISSDAPPEDIPDLNDRLVSRFQWGLVTRVEAPSYETRIEILKTKAEVRGFGLPDDVGAFLARRVSTNIRELEGVVAKLQMVSSVEGSEIDLDLARRALGDDAQAPPRRATIQGIIDAVTDYYGVRLADLQSKRKARSIAHPRQLCMYLARKHTAHSLEEIGGYFGGRDHTTVMHAVKTISDRREADTDLDATIRHLEGDLVGVIQD